MIRMWREDRISRVALQLHGRLEKEGRGSEPAWCGGCGKTTSRWSKRCVKPGSGRLDLRVNPGPTIGSAQEPVGFFVIADSPVLGVPGERSPKMQREVGQDAA